MRRASIIRFRSYCNGDWGVSYSRCFILFKSKKTAGFRSGESGSHSTEPLYPIPCCWYALQMCCWTLDTLWGESSTCRKYALMWLLNNPPGIRLLSPSEVQSIRIPLTCPRKIQDKSICFGTFRTRYLSTRVLHVELRTSKIIQKEETDFLLIVECITKKYASYLYTMSTRNVSWTSKWFMIKLNK